MNQELIEQVGKLAELQMEATPGPGEINQQYEQVWASESGHFVDTSDSPKDAAFIAAAGSLNFAALHAALTAPAPSSSLVGGGAAADAGGELLEAVAKIIRSEDCRSAAAILGSYAVGGRLHKVSLTGNQARAAHEIIVAAPGLLAHVRAATSTTVGEPAPAVLARINSRLADYRADDGPYDRHTVAEQYIEDVSALLAAAPALVEGGGGEGWVSVQERLPEPGKPFLALAVDGEMSVLRIYPDETWPVWEIAIPPAVLEADEVRSVLSDNFTHWQYLPATPHQKGGQHVA